MSTVDLVTIAVGIGGLIATILLGVQNNRIASQQNEIFREQDRIFAAQEGIKMPEPTPRNRFGLYWPTLVAVIIALGVGVIAARLQISSSKVVGSLAIAIPWSLSVFLVFCVVYLWKRETPKVAESSSLSKPSELNIIQAEYRAFADGGDKIDVTPVLKLKVTGDTLVHKVKSENFKAGGLDPVTQDPFEGQIKRVEVKYSYRNSSPVTTEAMEDDLLVLPEDILLDPLQRHALRLSIKLLQFLEQLGPSPMPKYTEEQIRNMPDRERLKPEVFNDPDYIDACEFHYPEGGHSLLGCSGSGAIKWRKATNSNAFPSRSIC